MNIPNFEKWAGAAQTIIGYKLPEWKPVLDTPLAISWGMGAAVNYEVDTDEVSTVTPLPTGTYPSKDDVTADPSSKDTLNTEATSQFNLTRPNFTIPVSMGIELPITGATRLSPNFRLIDLCKTNGQLPRPQHDLTQIQIVENLQKVAQYVLEEVKLKFPDMAVTSGFRPCPNPHSRAGKISWHEKGAAIDFGLTGSYPGLSKRNVHLLAAKYIQQLGIGIVNKIILEYTTKGQVWVHVQCHGTGTVGSGTNLPFTILNHTVVKSGFHVDM